MAVIGIGQNDARSGLFDGRDRELSLEMSAYFLNFIRTGDPNGTGLPQWEKVETRDSGLYQMPVMGFGDTTGMTVLPENYETLMRIMDEMQGFPHMIID